MGQPVREPRAGRSIRALALVVQPHRQRKSPNPAILNPRSARFVQHRGWGCGTLLGKEEAPLTRARSSQPPGSHCMSQPVPTHWAGYVHSGPANTALPKGQWRPQTCPCLIPHFSQRFKKHPWLTAEEGVWRHVPVGQC